MDEFNKILKLATRAIEEKYFHFPVAREGEPGTIYRERVYCYELYHQLRHRWPHGCPFVLNGEVDKSGHPLEVMRGLNRSPDFLVHRPGDMTGNHLIMEVKSAGARRSGILKDIETLQSFMDPERARYGRAILLIYGAVEDRTMIEFALDTLGDVDCGIEVWHHAGVGQRAARVQRPAAV